MTNTFLILLSGLIKDYEEKFGEKRFIAIRELVNNSNDTSTFLFSFLTNLNKPTLVNLIDFIEGNSAFSLFNNEDKKLTAIILIYRYYREVNLDLNIVSDDYMLEVTTDCIGFYSLTEKKIETKNVSSESREIQIKEEKSPIYLVVGLIILSISIFFAQDQSKLNDMKSNLVGLGVLIGVFTTLGGFFYYKSD